MAGAVEPGRAVAGVSDRTRATSDWLDGGRRSWLDWLVPHDEVVLRAAVLSLVVFIFGHLLARVAGYAWAYWRPWEMLGMTAVAGTIGTFLLLLILGRWGATYVAILARTEDCFEAADRPLYRAIVEDHLDRLYSARVDRLVDVKLVPVAFLLFTPAFLVLVQKFSLAEPYHYAFVLYYGVGSLLGIAAVFLFAVHIHLVDSLRGLDISNLYTAARDLGPVANHATTVATLWFALVTLVAAYQYLTLRAYTTSLVDWVRENGANALLAFPPVELLVLLTLLVGLVVAGLAVFLWPVWSLHGAISRGREELVAGVNERRNELVSAWETLAPTADAVEEFDLLDRVHGSTDRIVTWPDVVTDAVKVAVSASIPVSQVGLVLLG